MGGCLLREQVLSVSPSVGITGCRTHCTGAMSDSLDQRKLTVLQVPRADHLSSGQPVDRHYAVRDSVETSQRLAAERACEPDLPLPL